MSVAEHYRNLASRLVAAYTKQSLDQQVDTKYIKAVRAQNDVNFLNNITNQAAKVYEYVRPDLIEAALDTIDLPLIYSGLDEREKQHQLEHEHLPQKYGYQDLLVLQLLDYFKHHFFTWVNKPPCHVCSSEEHVQMVGVDGPPTPNPDEITMVEKFRCAKCSSTLTFPRLNSLKALLRDRRGRCGEWAACFLLVLKAVLGPSSHTRYVWNQEDHVWCEYYSTHLQRWIHLDPCEAAFDEPGLYSDNWGKKMSWVLGFGHGYVVDLSDKYVTKQENRIPKQSVVTSERLVARFIYYTNTQLLRRYYATFLNGSENEMLMKLYTDVLLLKSQEALDIRTPHIALLSVADDAPKGRQSGSAEWTQGRGESGK